MVLLRLRPEPDRRRSYTLWKPWVTWRIDRYYRWLRQRDRMPPTLVERPVTAPPARDELARRRSAKARRHRDRQGKDRR